MKMPTKTEMVRARCRPELKRSVQLVATIQELEEADIVRQALKEYVERFKAKGNPGVYAAAA